MASEKESIRPKYEARQSDCRPGGFAFSRSMNTFSVGIGEVVPKGKHQPAVVYRVGGSVNHEEQIDALAARLLSWLNNPNEPIKSTAPSHLPFTNDKSAKIRLTAAGRKAGFFGPDI